MDEPVANHPVCLCPGHVWQDSGLSSLTGDALRLFRELDGVFCQLAAEYRALDHVFPTFLPAAMLSRLDYFHSFPHLATFATALQDDEANLDAFRQRLVPGSDGSIRLTATMPVTDVLTPAACYHFYRIYEGARLDRPLYLTTLGSCHRRESHYVPLERQWNFNMREVVCIGSADEVMGFLEHYRERVARVCKMLDLPVAPAVASDPFFRPAQNPRWIAQRLEPLKTEFVFQNYLAATSINFHRDFFGETFGIQRGNTAAFSGCVAFGLERWMRMIIGRWGSDADGWPHLDEVRW
jgi:hypothetical protein